MKASYLPGALAEVDLPGRAGADGRVDCFFTGAFVDLLPDTRIETPAAITVTAATAAPAMSPTEGPDLAASAFLDGVAARVGVYIGRTGTGAAGAGAGATAGVVSGSGASTMAGCCATATVCGAVADAIGFSKRIQTQVQVLRRSGGWTGLFLFRTFTLVSGVYPAGDA